MNTLFTIKGLVFNIQELEILNHRTNVIHVDIEIFLKVFKSHAFVSSKL